MTGLYGLIKTKNNDSGSDKAMKLGFWPSFLEWNALIFNLLIITKDGINTNSI